MASIFVIFLLNQNTNGNLTLQLLRVELSAPRKYMIGPVKFDRARNFTLRMYFWIFFRSTLGLVPQNSSIQSKNIAKIIENLKHSPRAPFWIFKDVFCNLDIFGAELAIIAPRWESHEAEIDPLYK